MKYLPHLFEANAKWAKETTQKDPLFFSQLLSIQAPSLLWIGCSDSRVPANQITGLKPGEVFVHRNVANIVAHTDINCLSVIQYAVEILKVEHIVVCGHYRCGGIKAVLDDKPLGLIDNWLLPIHDIFNKHSAYLTEVTSYQKKWDILCELNVIEQVAHVANSTIIRNAWKNENKVFIHGWIYSLENGLLKDLDTSVKEQEEVDLITNRAIKERFSHF